MSNNITPYIFCYDDLVDVYLGTSQYQVPSIENKFTGDLEKERRAVLTILKENEAVLKKVEAATVKFAQQMVLLNPTIYIARTRDTKTDIVYFTAKTFWPMMDGKRKEIKIHLGREEEFDKDTKSKRAKNEALVKMRQTIARRLREGSL